MRSIKEPPLCKEVKQVAAACRGDYQSPVYQDVREDNKILCYCTSCVQANNIRPYDEQIGRIA